MLQKTSSRPLPLPQAEVAQIHSRLKASPFLREFFDAMPFFGAVVNESRQVLLANTLLVKASRRSDAEVLGYRLGEILDCVNSRAHPDGCGNSGACRYCGLLRLVDEAFEKNEASEGECRVRSCSSGPADRAYDLKVRCNPFKVGGKRFLSLGFLDISGEKRRQVLERVFFHDIINTAGSLKGMVEMLAAQGSPDTALIQDMEIVAGLLLEDILVQKEIAAAEKDELSPESEFLEASSLLEEAGRIIRRHPVSDRRVLEIKGAPKGLGIETDRHLVLRVLGNMLINAFEASPRGAAVGLGAKASPGVVRFEVSNPGVLEPGVRAQIFQRSFSTKSPSRGLGTYGMKLLTEKYLGGRVGFSSSVSEGTLFWIELPACAPR